MRPGPVIVAVLSLILSIMGVAWLSQSIIQPIDVPGQSSATKIEDQPDFPKPSETGPHPKVTFEETEFDFGTRPRFSKGTHKFVVTNNGEAELKLKTGRTTCQCTLGELGKNTVAPGESTTIELSWEIKQAGPGFMHSAQIHTNDPANPAQTLVVKGFIGIDLAVWPADRWSLGSMKVDGQAKIDGYVYSQLSENLEITKVESSHPGLTFEVKQLTREEMDAVASRLTAEATPPPDPHGKDVTPQTPDIKAAARIMVTADHQIPVGQFSIPVTIHTNLDETPTLSIAVSGVRPGPYQFFPLPGTNYQHSMMSIAVGEISSAKEHESGLLVICRGFDEELKLKDVEADPSWLKVELEPAPGEGDVRRYRLLLKFPAGLPSMVRSSSNPATLKLRTNHPDAETLNLKATFVVEE
ncbi:MAG: DUF1573 domain-containing protein [Planctomycetota bacterium]|nr:DUF1573 domain-containing protein [Planctomycetota bacterium]MDA0918591.1 DUF1573 domain-containing protein [Planctomycetota bacterium]MDA1159871.1 DUF1573 domain-containing protein [Planctomycetota bacterium]